MICAALQVTLASWSSGHDVVHTIDFDSLETASAEFDRIAALLKRRGDKANDLPKFLDIVGVSKLTCDFSMVCALGLLDHAKANAERIGVADTFPHLYKK